MVNVHDIESGKVRATRELIGGSDARADASMKFPDSLHRKNELTLRFRDILFTASPLARRLLPRPVLRFLHLRVLAVNRPYAELFEAPSRRCLEREILPWLAARFSRILFVGTASYTYHYERLFKRDQYTTIDRHPSAAVWGSHDHIVAAVQDINRHRRKGSFDCVVLNGVFGFGINAVEDMRIVLKELHDALRPDGFLLVGWNAGLHDDPEALGIYEPYFVRNRETPWVERRYFPPETHVYDFYRPRPG
jgi:SAM-dependent methyltransferase